MRRAPRTAPEELFVEEVPMNGVHRRVGRGVVVFGAFIAGACSALAQNSGKPQSIETLLVAEKADFSQCLNDPRDARLKNALSMIPARVRELPGEVGAPQEPIDAVTMILGAMSRPGRMAIVYSTAEKPAGNPADGMFGYGVVFSAQMPDQDTAEQFHARIKSLLADAQLPPPPAGPKRFATMDDLIAGPLGRLSYGPRKAADGWRYEVVVGTLDNPDLAWQNLRPVTIKDLKPFIHGSIDLAGLTPAVNMFASFAGPQNPQVSQMIRDAGAAGLYGPDAMKITFEVGSTATESRGRAVIEGAARYRDKLGMAEGQLEDADFSAVPADAVMASISKGDLSMFEHMIDKAAEQGAPVEEQLEQFKSQTGVDLRADILRTLGGTFAYYMSDSTGGGNAGSLVGLISFKDRAKFMTAHEKLVKFANGMLENAPEFGRYARVASWTEAGVELMSLRFSGLPIPLEITYAATEKWLIAGVTPQAALAAAQQVAGKGDRGILANERASTLARSRKLSSFSFIDTARMMRPGYPILCMAGSAIASGVRTPAFVSGPGRDPGMIVPTYRELAKDVKNNVALSYWDGDNFVVDSHGDHSVLVAAAGGIGTVINLLPAIAVPAAAIGAAADQHRNQHMDMDEDDQGSARLDRMVPLWTSPDVFGWALRTHPAVTAAAISASGPDRWIVSVLERAR